MDPSFRLLAEGSALAPGTPGTPVPHDSSLSHTSSKSGLTVMSVVYGGFNGYDVTSCDIIISIVQVVMAGWIIGLNSLVLDTLIRLNGRNGSRDPTDVLLASLSITDILSGIFILHTCIYSLSKYQNTTECLVRMAVFHGALYSSIFHLIILTSDRYIKILFPFRYISLCRGRLIVGLLLVTWTAAGVVALVPMLLWSSRHDDLNPPCSFFGLLKADYQRLMVSLFIAPSIVMVLAYLHIFKVARRHSRAITAHDVGLRMKEGHTWRYTKTMLAVVGLYIVCWTPAGLVIMLSLAGCLSGYTVEEKGSLLLYACIPAFGNSLVNPALYALKIPAVRRRFRAVFCRPCMAAHPVTLTDPTCTLIASLHHRVQI